MKIIISEFFDLFSNILKTSVGIFLYLILPVTGISIIVSAIQYLYFKIKSDHKKFNFKKYFLRNFKFIIPIYIGIFCIYLTLKNVPFSDLSKYFYKINYSWVLLGVVFGALSHISRSYRWKYLISPMGYKLGFINSILSVFSAYLINYTIPRAGDLARATMVSKYEDIPLDKTIGTIVAERVVDVICILLLISFALVVEFDKISTKLTSLFQETNFSKILIYIVFLTSTLIIIYFIIRRLNIKNLLSNFFSGIYEGIIVIFKMDKSVWFILHSFFIWIMYLLMFWATSMAFIELHDVPSYQLIIAFTLAALSIMFSNGGIGIYPLSVGISLSWYGIELTTGLAFGWVSWLSQTMLVVIFGGISLIILPFINKSKT
ncbi:MAG: TIGR00374 family protein [Rickettsiales bacterium]|nr:TIGR00374 family protein [Rickettsiales bacterium]|tara:strand:- start:1636 stop:2760 length:1125 start_codon:yes stop_codon:yes gene_type:complete